MKLRTKVKLQALILLPTAFASGVFAHQFSDPLRANGVVPNQAIVMIMVTNVIFSFLFSITLAFIGYYWDEIFDVDVESYLKNRKNVDEGDFKNEHSNFK